MIGFLQPLALIGLAFAAIPPLLHLMQRRLPTTVTFPALRYLEETERRHSRRIRLRHLLLMALRTLIILLIALAASRPIVRVPGGSGHEPVAIGLAVDNSLSSGAVVDGQPVLATLIDRAQVVLDRATADDRIWLAVADGLPQRLTIPEAREFLDTLRSWPVRMDLPATVSALTRALRDAPGLPPEIVVVSDLQATALHGRAEGADRVLVWAAPAPLRENRGVDSAWADPPVWAPDGQVVLAVGGRADNPASIRLSVAERDVGRSIGRPGDRVVLSGPLRPGWHQARVVLDPDELRADDERHLGLYVAPPRPAAVGIGAGPFAREAFAVLRAAGRVLDGGAVHIDAEVAPGEVSVVLPPADDALIGAVNRSLAERGIGWQFGPRVSGAWEIEGPVPGAGEAVRLRRRLEGDGAALVTVGGEPWIVRESNTVLVGSRLDPEWSTLPVSAGFVPFLDFVVNRLAGSAAWIVEATPGANVQVPQGVVAYRTPEGSTPVGADRSVFAPMQTGVFFLVGSHADTVGALQVNHDPRESELLRAPDGAVRQALGGNALVLDRGAMDRELFLGARRADLTGPLILVVIVLAVVELGVATVGGGRSKD